MPPILIGLTGRRGSGKDTAASFIREWGEGRGLSVIRRSFADKLKHSAMTALGFQVAEQDAIVLADSLKELGEITTYIPNQSVAYTIDGRKFLQLYGTESHRDIFGSDFWVDALLPKDDWQRNFSRMEGDSFFGWRPEVADIAVIADVRFDNEARRIRELGGYVWEIQRPGHESDGHVSEAGVSPDLIDKVIANDSSLTRLEQEISSEMTIEFHMRFVKSDMEDAG